MVRWLGERLTIGQFLTAAAPTSRARHSRLFPRDYGQFNAMPGIFPGGLLSSLTFGRRALTSQGDQRRADTAAPAEPRAVTPVPKPRRFAAAPRPRVLTDAR